MLLDWWKAREIEVAKAKKAIQVARKKQKMRVRCLDREGLTLFETRGMSLQTKEVTKHRVTRQGEVYTCDCLWKSGYNRISDCKHILIVKLYIKRNGGAKK